MAEEQMAVIYTDPSRSVSVLAEGRNTYAIQHCDAEGKLVWSQGLEFQTGPHAEAGINGIQNEELIALVIDRLSKLNSLLPCGENAAALRHLEDAHRQLIIRQQNRKANGTEGTNKP